MTERVCFQLQVRPERIEDYTRRHARIWPDMAQALDAAGWRNYSLFLRPDGLLIGYVEVDDFAAAQDAMAANAVNTRWQAEMAPFFVDAPPSPAGQAPGLVRLEEVFHLQDQLDDPTDTRMSE